MTAEREWRSRTDWVRCTTFFPNVIERVTADDVKGRLCFVEGRLQIDEGQGKDRKTWWNVIVERFVMIEGKQPGEWTPAVPGPGDDSQTVPEDMPAEGEPVVDDDDKVPF